MSDDNKEGAGVPVRECGNSECGWKGRTDRMLGSVGPLCPECGETTELAVMPAAPSDAEIDALDKTFALHVMAPRGKASVHEFARAVLALSQTMQPQAGAVYVDSAPHLHIGDSAFEDWYQNYLPNSVGHKQIARDAYAAGMGDPLVVVAPAAGEQAGAVADESLHPVRQFSMIGKLGKRLAQLLDEDQFAECEDMLLKIENGPWRNLSLAAPDAAIAAREQEALTDDDLREAANDFGSFEGEDGRWHFAESSLFQLLREFAALASPKEAPATPQGEAAGLSEVTERYCNKCGYFGPDQIHYRPNGLGECGYIARIRTQPTTVQQAEKGGA